MKKLSPGKKRLLEYLGEPYTTMTIDWENCVYLDMNDYDIEISGGKTIRSRLDIYVWQKRGRLQIIERHMGVKSDLPIIKKLLDDIRNRYSSEHEDAAEPEYE